MSVRNVLVTPDKVIAVVDSAGINQDGVSSAWSKALYLPHAQTLLVARGERNLFYFVFTRLFFALGISSFDELLAKAPSELSLALEEYTERGCLPIDMPGAGLEICLAGWSDTRQRMVAQDFRAHDRVKGFQDEGEVRHTRLAPGADWTASTCPEVATGDDLVVAARYQVAWLREQFPEFPAGGELNIAAISKNSATIEAV